MPEPNKDRSAALKVLRKIAEDEQHEVASRVRAAELILKATESRRTNLAGWQQQQQRGVFQ
jgi:hypothetical protein